MTEIVRKIGFSYFNNKNSAIYLIIIESLMHQDKEFLFPRSCLTDFNMKLVQQKQKGEYK